MECSKFAIAKGVLTKKQKMIKNTELLERVKKLKEWKKGKAFIAKELNITEEEVGQLLAESRGDVETEVTEQWMERMVDEKGTLKSSIIVDYEPKTPEELAELHKVDLSKYKISSYWTKQRGDKFTSSLLCTLIKPEQDIEAFQERFIDFLKSYKTPKIAKIASKKNSIYKTNGCLVINKQDEHINKQDINGNNDMEERMENVLSKISIILEQSCLSNNLETIKYIVGSDEFNAEWTGMTVKFTPQSNIDSYQESFKAICNYEVRVISTLLAYSDDIEVVYLSGNHDEFVGWHLINWLKTYFKDTSNISFDESPRYRKYIKYSNTAMMLNHGDAIKPEKLAGMFPIEYKDEWSSCDNFFIFTGDKHHLLAKDFNGIQFYQIPSLSKATSAWDDKNGHTCSKAELTAFMIEENNGMTNIYKQPL